MDPNEEPFDDEVEDEVQNLEEEIDDFDVDGDLQGIDEEEEIDEEIEDSMEVLHPDHPAMQRIQRALKAQLLTQNNALADEIREMKKQLRLAQKQREDHGVELYELQQQYAAQQDKLAKTHDAHQVTQKDREDMEEALKKLNENYAGINEMLAKTKKESHMYQQQYDELSRKVKQLEEKNREMKASVQVQKLAAKKAVKDEAAVESEKMQQDLLVDGLNERIKSIEREITTTKKRRQAQEEETKTAKSQLREANNEVEAIQMEKKEIQQQWTQSTLALEKRNEALVSMETAVLAQRQEMFAKQTEGEAVLKLITSEESRNEVKTHQLSGIDTKIGQNKKKVEELLGHIAEIKKSYSLVQKALQDTDENLRRANMEVNIQQSEINQLRVLIEKDAKRKTDLEQEIETLLYNKLTLDNAGKNLAKRITKAQRLGDEQDGMLVQVENEVAVQRNIIIDVEGQIAEAKGELQALLDDIKEKEALIAKYETESSRNAVLIQRKQDHIDQLNKKIGQIADRLKQEGEGAMDLTPGDIEIRALQRQITEISKECSTYRDQWLSRQHELVSLRKQIQAGEDEVEMIKTKLEVLTEKRFRKTTELEALQSDIAGLKRVYANLQNDVVKLNKLITQNQGVQTELQENNVLMEEEFLRRLKEEEMVAVQLQTRVAAIQDEARRSANAIIEAEEQILLWEKKVQIAKETKEQVRGNESREELDGMRMEIHRMEVRAAQLEREKEKILQAMELSITKRESIHLKSRQALTSNTGSNTTAALQRQIVELTKKVKQVTLDSQRCDEDMQTLGSMIRALEGDIEHSQGGNLDLQRQLDALQQTVQDLTAQKEANTKNILMYQAQAKHFNHALENKLKLKCKDPAQYEQSIEAQVNTTKTLNNIVEYLAKENPAFQKALRPLQSSIQSHFAYWKVQ